MHVLIAGLALFPVLPVDVVFLELIIDPDVRKTDYGGIAWEM